MNPKFVNKKEAWEIFKNGIKDLNEEEIISVAEEQKKIATRICDLLKIIPDIFEKVIIRVHPIESQKIYKEATSLRKNVIFSSEVDIFQDFKAANTVVHGYSTAGLEAVLCGKKVFCIEKKSKYTSMAQPIL